MTASKITPNQLKELLLTLITEEGFTEAGKMKVAIECLGFVIDFREVRSALLDLVRDQKISRGKRPPKGKFARFAWTYHPFVPRNTPTTLAEMKAEMKRMLQVEREEEAAQSEDGAA